MRLSDDTYEEIKQAVADMFVDYDIKGVPLCSFEVAIKIGMTVIPYSALDSAMWLKAVGYSEDGYSVETNEGEWIIYYNDEDKDYSRINQTIMHEIGHYILGHTEEGEIEEAEAKFFAKYALASPPLIHNMKKEQTTENVMEAFDIGYMAACYALQYYRKWMKYGKTDYVDYEIKIMDQLEIEIA
jgi:Zn-dependent peptidase ImmA (M78 family)